MNHHATPFEFDIDLSKELQAAVTAGDAARLDALFDRLSLSEGLCELLDLSTDDRRVVLTLIRPEMAADLIEEAPHEVGADHMEELETTRAVELMDEMDSDVQADLIGGMEDEEAEAILSQMDAEDAADVRRLSNYDDDTAGGLMMSEVFECANTMTVSDVIKVLARDDEDVDRYRGQHPYIIDADEKLVGVVFLRGLLATKRSALLTTIMVDPMTVQAHTALSDLDDIFDKYDFLGVPVVDAEGRLLGVVSRDAVSQALLERAESENLKFQGVVGDELRSLPTWLARAAAWRGYRLISF